MSALSVKNTYIHFDYSEIHIIFAVFNLNFSCMLTFTIIKSKKSERFFIINSDGVELAQAVSLAQCFNYFYSWCGKLACKAVTFTCTEDSNVILVNMK